MQITMDKHGFWRYSIKRNDKLKEIDASIVSPLFSFRDEFFFFTPLSHFNGDRGWSCSKRLRAYSFFLSFFFVFFFRAVSLCISLWLYCNCRELNSPNLPQYCHKDLKCASQRLWVVFFPADVVFVCFVS